MARILGNSVNEIVSQLGLDNGPTDRSEFVVPHMLSFQSMLSSMAKVYRPSDEALKNAWQSAIAMRNDCGLMECLEGRQRATALLDWQLVPEDENSQEQKDLCAELTKMLERIPRFTEYRRVLLEGLWYGRYGIQNRYRRVNIGGTPRLIPGKLDDMPDSDGWKPINGDKLVFRFDDGNLNPETGQYPDQVGIRVSSRFSEGALIAQKWRVENVSNAFTPTDQGMAYFLGKQDRKQIVIHKHLIEDGDYYSSESAGSIHGVGIRSRVYWDWYQKQECLAFLMEFLERSAGGIEVWYYPSGNPEAEEACKKAATERVAHQRNIIFCPKPPGEDSSLFGVEIIEPGMSGVESLKDLLQNFFGHRVKRYILGQILTTEAGPGGLASAGIASAHLDTFLQIVRYDAANLDETLTTELVRPLQLFNFPKSAGIYVRLKILTEDEDIDKKLDGYFRLFQMGAALPLKDVFSTAGVRVPDGIEPVLQQQQQLAGGFGGIGGDGQPTNGNGIVGPARQAVDQQGLLRMRDQLRQQLLSRRMGISVA